MPGSSTASALSSRAPSSPEQAAARGSRARRPSDAPQQESVSDVVRWAAFSCVLVPVVLVGYGISMAGAGGAALGLAAVTGVCRVLLRQSERCAARLLAEQNTAHRGRHGRTASGAHRGMRHGVGNTPVD